MQTKHTHTRMRLHVNSDATVTIQYQDKITGDIHSRTFMAQPEQGYVRERSGDSWHQTCDRLLPYGAALTCGRRADLPGVIRREYRALRRAERRAMLDLGLA